MKNNSKDVSDRNHCRLQRKRRIRGIIYLNNADVFRNMSVRIV